MELRRVALSLQSPKRCLNTSVAGCGCTPPIPSEIATYRMSRWRKSASARILSSDVDADAVSAATSCLMSGEASRRPWVRSLYQLPMSDHDKKPRFFPPGGTSDTIIRPATPFHGGISGSHLIAGRSFASHCHWLFPLGVG